MFLIFSFSEIESVDLNPFFGGGIGIPHIMGWLLKLLQVIQLFIWGLLGRRGRLVSLQPTCSSHFIVRCAYQILESTIFQRYHSRPAFLLYELSRRLSES